MNLNGGEKWDPTGLTSVNINILAIDPLAPANIYAGTNNGGVFKTANGGVNWIPFSTGLTSLNVHALAIDPATPAGIYAGTDAGVFVFMGDAEPATKRRSQLTSQ